MRAQPIAQSEIDQRARGIGRELDAGAGLLEPLGLLQDGDAKAVARERQRGGETANAGPGDNDGARGRQDTRSGRDLNRRVGQGAFRRTRRVRRERRIVAIERRAIGADVFGVVAHVTKHMRMIERRLGADAHEFPGADLDDRDAQIVVEMGNDRVRHSLGPAGFYASAP